MNTVRNPPAAPPAQTAYQDSGDAGGHNVQVTRNVPPKRVMVNTGNTVSWDDKSFSEGDTVVLPGPMADQLAFAGHVVVVEHEAEAKGYKHADGADAIPVDVTSHRQQLGQQHMIEGRQMTAKEGGAK